MSNRIWKSAVVVSVALFLVMPGCGGNTKKAAQEQSNLKPLMVFCGQFRGPNQGRAPANDDELKAFIKSKGPEALQSFKVADVDALFTSPRDNQPYVILYEKLAESGGVPGMPAPSGSNPGTPGPSGGGSSGLGGQPVVAYEATGVNGKRFVASAIGAIEEVDEKKFRELVPSAK